MPDDGFPPGSLQLFIETPFGDVSSFSAIGIVSGTGDDNTDAVPGGMITLGSTDSNVVEDGLVGSVTLDSYPDTSNGPSDMPRLANLQILVNENTQQPTTIYIGDPLGEDDIDMVLFRGGAMALNPSNGGFTDVGLDVTLQTDITGMAVQASDSQSANLQEWRDSDGTAIAWIGSDGTPGGTLENTAVTTEHDFFITGDGSLPTTETQSGVGFGVESSTQNPHIEVVAPSDGLAYIDLTTINNDYMARLAWDDSNTQFTITGPGIKEVAVSANGTTLARAI